MEGLLQSFKFDKEYIQVEVCKLTGIKAKRRGQKRNKAWKSKQTLWWKGKAYPRKSKEYTELIERAFDALATNEKFISDIRESGNAVYKHSMGRRNKAETVLTIQEFCGNLNRIRSCLRQL